MLATDTMRRYADINQKGKRNNHKMEARNNYKSALKIARTGILKNWKKKTVLGLEEKQNSKLEIGKQPTPGERKEENRLLPGGFRAPDCQTSSPCKNRFSCWLTRKVQESRNPQFAHRLSKRPSRKLGSGPCHKPPQSPPAALIRRAPRPSKKTRKPRCQTESTGTRKNTNKNLCQTMCNEVRESFSHRRCCSRSTVQQCVRACPRLKPDMSGSELLLWVQGALTLLVLSRACRNDPHEPEGASFT